MITRAARNLSLLVMIIPLILLSACSSISIPGLSAISTTQTQSSSSATAVQNNLGFGILKLGETDLTISADQARTLLPLWMAVRSLGTDSSASQVEILALYEQIEESLTPEQVSAIEQMNPTQSELASVMQKYGSIRQVSAQSTSNNQSSTKVQGGPPDGGGMPGGDMMMEVGMTGQVSSVQSQQSSQTASSKAANVQTLNVMLADSVVTMLKQIISA